MIRRFSRRHVVRSLSVGAALVAATPILAACGAAAPTAAPPATAAASTRKLAFGVGPLLPTPGDTKKAFDPFFK